MSEDFFQSPKEYTFKDFKESFKKYFLILKLNIRILSILIFLGIILGYVYSIVEKPQYKAELTFALDDEKANLSGAGAGIGGGALGIASSLGIDLGSGGGGAFAASNLIELMKSRLIVERALLNTISNQKITAIELYIKNNKIGKKISNDPRLSKITFPIGIKRAQTAFLQDSILKEVYKEIVKENLSIFQKDKKITIITININSNNELFSKYFADIIAKEVSEFYIETKSKKARINVEILQRQADSIKNELGLSILKMANQRDVVYNLNPSMISKETPSRKKQIEIQSNTAILTQLIAQLEIAKVTLRKETPLIQLIDIPRFPLDKYEINPFLSSLIGGLVLAFFTIAYLILFKKNK